MALSWAWPVIMMPSPPLGMAVWMSLFVPTAVSVTCTPVALPPSSMPLPRLPETMQVRIRLLPPLEVTRIPSRLFGAAPPNAIDPGEGVERGESAGRAAHLDAVPVVAGDHVAQRDHAADLRILGRARDQQPVAAIGHDRGVVGPDAHEIGLDRRVVGIGDPQAVAAVAAEHVVEHERTLLERAADQLIAVGLDDGHAVLAVAQGRIARGGRADEIPAQQRSGWPRR